MAAEIVRAREVALRSLFEQILAARAQGLIEGAAGLGVVRASFDNQIGGLGVSLDGVMNEGHQMRTFIIGAGGGLAGLEAAPLSYSVADATVVFNTFADFDQLWSIYTGAASQSSLRGNSNPYDYRTNLSLIAGTDVHLR